MSDFTVTKLIAIAEAEIGYKEKKSNAQLDSKTANAGSANFQKYGRDLYAAGFFNGNKNGFEWCAQFVTWCFFKLCGDRKLAEKMLCQTGTLAAGCGYAMQYYKDAGRFDKVPKIGDQIFFRYSGNSGADHTGIVIAVTNSKITTIEGNKNNQVSKCVYDRNYSCILGYGHPRYDAEEETSTDKGAKTVNIEMTVLRSGSTGAEVKTLQRLLKSRGWKDADGKALKIDGDFGGKTEAALKKFQKAKELTVDGVCGSATWKKVLKE